MSDSTQAAIAFGNLLETSSEEIAGATAEAYNVIADAKSVLRKRPGLALYTGTAPSTAVDANGVLGLYVTDSSIAHTTGSATVSGTHAATLYAVGATVNASGAGHNRGRNVYVVAGGTATLVGTGATNEDRLSTPASIATTRYPRPSFVETESLLVVAGGAEVGKIDIRQETFSAPNFTNPNATLNQMSFLGGCPPLASHIITNSSRILANDTQLDQTKIRYSDITQGITDFSGHESWDPSPGAAGFFTAEAKSDPIVCVFENTNDIFVFGTRNLQLFGPDSSMTFAPSITRETGCLAAYSPVKVDDQYIWIDHLTRVVQSDGRQWQDIGGPVQRTLNAYTTPSDAYGYRYKESFADCVVFRFEASQDTLVYQPNIGWGKWAQYNSTTGAFTMFPVLCHHQRQDGGLNLVGLEDGRICTLSLTNTTDIGTAIVAWVKTGFIDRDSDNLKVCLAVRLVFKRETTTANVTCYLDYRDNLRDDWQELPIELGTEDGDLNPVITLRSLGLYRRRQWRFRFPDKSELRLVRVSEEFTTLEQ